MNRKSIYIFCKQPFLEPTVIYFYQPLKLVSHLLRQPTMKGPRSDESSCLCHIFSLSTKTQSLRTFRVIAFRHVRRNLMRHQIVHTRASFATNRTTQVPFSWQKNMNRFQIIPYLLFSNLVQLVEQRVSFYDDATIRPEPWHAMALRFAAADQLWHHFHVSWV